MRRFLIIAMFLVVGILHGGQLPPAPAITPQRALELADAYVHKKFPQFPDIYCSEMRYEQAEDSCIHSPDVLWRFRYLLPNNPGELTGGDHPRTDYGVCLVYMAPDGTITHSTDPKRNAEPE